MAGAQAQYAMLAAQITSADSAALTTLAYGFRFLGAYAGVAGTTLTGSADRVGARQGAPYAAYQDRLTPTAGWLGRMRTTTDPTATTIDSAATAVRDAQMELATVQETVRSAYAPGSAMPRLQAAVIENAYVEAVARLQPKVDAMTASYTAIKPGATSTPPAARGGGAGGAAPAGAGGGGAAATTRSAPSDGGADGAATDVGGADVGGAGGAGADGAAAARAQAAGAEASAIGPDSGQYAGWVKDPQTGNLIDPATGREVSSQGRFVDPITGRPFGDPSQYATRLEGLAGGVGGLLSPPGGVAASLGVPGGAIGVAGGSGGYAGYFGGVVPPSLAGNSPISGQLERQAARNMSLRAAAAGNYAAIVNGTPNEARPGYLPPMGGAGAGAGGAGGGARPGPRGRGLVTEPGCVWGATGRGAEREGRRREGASRTELVEDADVWTGGAPPTGAGTLRGN